MKRTVSKQTRVLLNLLLIAMALTAAGFFSGLPSPLLRLQYRAEERANLIGPGEILGIEDADFSMWDHMIVAQTDEGAILWVSSRDHNASTLAYRETGEGTILMAAPGALGSGETVSLPLVLFNDQPRARWAELRFTLWSDLNGEHFEKSYTLTSQRHAQSYFLFRLDADIVEPRMMDAELAAIQTFANISAGLEKDRDYAVAVQVTYFDASGDTIGEESMIISSAYNDRT